jgi:elongation factor 1-beta
MGSLIVRMKILPNDVDIKTDNLIESIKAKLPERMTVRKALDEPIAFGLVAVIVDIQIDEKEGLMDALEGAVRSSDLVSQADVIGVSRDSTSLK